MRAPPARSHTSYLEKGRALLTLIFEAYSSIFFTASTRVGVLFFIASLLVPNVGVHGILAVIMAAFILRNHWYRGRLARFTRYILCNAALFGLGIGSQFLLSFESIALLAMGVVAVIFLYDLISEGVMVWGLPTLSLPFAVASVIFALWTHALAPLVHLEPYRLYLNSDFHFEGVLSGVTLLFETLGSLLFVPSSTAGILMAIGILSHSRILFFLVIWAVLLSVLGSHIFYPSLLWKNVFPEVSFSAILCGVALGGYFLPFSKKSVAVASLGIALAIVWDGALRVVSTAWGISTLSMPYVFSTWMVYAFLRRRSAHSFVLLQGQSPEETLFLHLSRMERFGPIRPVLKLPYLEQGELQGKIWQGFGGRWTHQGIWKNALDFVFVDAAGKTHRNEGWVVEDYYSYGISVTSPCDGEVVQVENSLPDRAIGFLDQENNWGNYVLIYVRLGYFVLLAHLKQNSVQVQRGSLVYAGQRLAEIGNSGYSPQPHLHLHVQSEARLGSETIPFRILSYQAEPFTRFFRVPREGERAIPLRQNKALQFALSFSLGQELHFEYQEGAVARPPITLRVSLDEREGYWFLDDLRGGQVSFWKDADLFYFYDLRFSDSRAAATSPLSLLVAAFPRFPLTFGEEITWEEYLPLNVAFRGIRKFWFESIVFFVTRLTSETFNRIHRARVSVYRLQPSGFELRGEVLLRNERLASKVIVDPVKGLQQVQVGNRILSRMDKDHGKGEIQ